MGSGSYGPYSGTNGSSQKYSETYSVVGKMLAKDKADPDIYNPHTGYFHNPTANDIEKATKGNYIFIDNKKPNGPITYVLDESGQLIIGKRYNPNDSRKRSPHPTLIGGKNPKVQCAGIITFKNGKIFSYDNNSGHFRPNSQSLPKVKKILDSLYEKNPYLFAKDSEWRKRK